MKDEYTVCDLSDRQKLEGMILRWLPHEQADKVRVFVDTTDIFKIEFNDVVMLQGIPFLVRHNAREGRFGVDDEVKFWVKRAIDLTSGQLKILKLVFFEKFYAHIGGIEFPCYRNPRKEARVLDLVQGHPNFMQGYAVPDAKGNTVRVIEFIHGQTLASYIEDLSMDHERYFFDFFPRILDSFIQCVLAIGFLHRQGEKHGDIRRDHILIDRDRQQTYRWIDFDYTYYHRENRFGYDLFGLGNILMFLVGKGDVLLPGLREIQHPALDSLTNRDVNIVFHHRVANLRKIFPYIPDALNRILLHFSTGAACYYEHTAQLLEDLENCRAGT